MTDHMTTGLRPTHPGELLREDVLPAVGRSKSEIAELLGISRQHLYDLLNERKPVTTPTALRLAKLFGGAAETWLRLQQAYDLQHASMTMAEELERIPTLEVA